LLKLTNYLQFKTTYVFLTIVFKVGLLLYLRLTSTSINKNTLIEHKEVAVICKENGHVNMNYNVILTTPKVNVGVKPIVHAMTIKST